MRQLPPINVMRDAFAKKDPSFDGTFFVAVKTTSVFCRPVCRAKPPRPENVEFFATAREALCRGYRPCKLCRPAEERVNPPPIVAKLIEMIERDPHRRLRERDLREMKIEPSTARRQFRAYCNTTFAAYQRARRMGLALREVRERGASVTRAGVGAGFDSSSGFRDAFSRMFGTNASHAKDIGVLTAQRFTTPLGPMIAVASDEGIVLLDFADRRGLERALDRLRQRFAQKGVPLAAIVPGDHRHLAKLQSELAEYFSGDRHEFVIPIAPIGSEFERRAWDFLRTIPFGETRSYRDEARALRSPRAVRAVGRANGMNYISIIVPCHRVIGANGELTGYGGGLARKRWLLDHERGVAQGSSTELSTSAARG